MKYDLLFELDNTVGLIQLVYFTSKTLRKRRTRAAQTPLMSPSPNKGLVMWIMQPIPPSVEQDLLRPKTATDMCQCQSYKVTLQSVTVQYLINLFTVHTDPWSQTLDVMAVIPPETAEILIMFMQLICARLNKSK